MIRLPPRSTRADTLFPYTTLFRSLLRNFVVKAEARLHAGQRNGLEPLLLGGFAQRVEILPGAREQFLRLGKLDPAVGDGLVGAAILAVGQILGAGVARFDDVPARSEERRVGKECVRPCRSRVSPYH